jgi:hypothetical protein
MKKHREEEERSQTLDEILINEGLWKKEVRRGKLLWQRGVAKILILLKERHY